MKVKFYILLSCALLFISVASSMVLQAMQEIPEQKNESSYRLIVDRIENNDSQGALDTLKRELKKGFDVNYLGKMRPGIKETLLSKAVKSGDIDLVRTLLNAGANPNIESINELFGTALMPLHLALSIQYPEKRLMIIKELIKAGADVNARNSMNLTPLMSAVTSGDESLIQTLLSVPDIDLMAKNVSGNTALDLARRYHPELLKLLEPRYMTLKSKSLEAIKKYRGQQIPEEQIKQLPEELQEALR